MISFRYHFVSHPVPPYNVLGLKTQDACAVCHLRGLQGALSLSLSLSHTHTHTYTQQKPSFYEH